MSEIELAAELEIARRSLSFINGFTRQAMTLEQPYELWPLLADHLASFFGCERVSCYMLHNDTLVSLHAQGLDKAVILNLTGDQSKGIAAHVARTGKIYWTNDPAKDPHFAAAEEPGFTIRNITGCAIYHEKTVLGVVELFNKKSAVTEQEAKNLENLAPQIGFILSHLQSIREKKQLESTLAKAGKLQAVGELAALAARELAGPLMNIATTVQILSMRLPVNSELQKELLSIEEDAHRGQHAIAELTHLIPPETLKLKPVALDQVLDSALEPLKKDIAIRGIQTFKRFPEKPVPPQADEFLLIQVLRQLISNAMLAMPSGGTLIFQAERKENFMHLEIKDSGKGISAQDLPHVFEPFYKISYAGEKAEMELATCLSIIESMGGTLRVQSEGDSKGSVFTIALPTAMPV